MHRVSSFKTSSHFFCLHARFPNDNDADWNEWVRRNKKTTYKFDVKIQPIPYSNHEANVDAMFGIDRFVKNEQVQMNQFPILDTFAFTDARNDGHRLFAGCNCQKHLL